MTELTQKRCLPCEGGVKPLNHDESTALLKQLNDWKLSDDAKWISRKLSFKNFEETMEFVNSVAKVAEEENHHPDVSFGYNYCDITFQTHAIDGLSENDFICAAKIDALFSQSFRT